MALIELTTVISAPAHHCFDLARSIDFHKLCMQDTGEEAVDGVTSGLISDGQTVTWRARHLGFKHMLTSKITAFQFPYYFRDEMVRGPFKRLIHDHIFIDQKRSTTMIDVFRFDSPAGAFGKLIDNFLLKRYLANILLRRNQMIKEFAESNQLRLIPHFDETSRT